MLSLGGGWQQSASQIWFGLAALMLALHFNFNSRCAQRIPALLLTCIQLFVTGSMGGLVASLTFETWPQEIGLNIWGWFAMSVVIATSLRYVMQTTGAETQYSRQCRHYHGAGAGMDGGTEYSVVWRADADE